MKKQLVPAVAMALWGCAAAPMPWGGATPESWRSLQTSLAKIRQLRPSQAWSATVNVTIQAPRRGNAFPGRGGMAVLPGQAVRIVLVGGAGATLLDAWVTPRQWRVAIPPLGIIRRGGPDDPGDFPIAFLRWWFFRSLDGRLFAARVQGHEPRWLLHDAHAVIDVQVGSCDRAVLLRVARRELGRTERVEECRASVTPTAGDHVRYQAEQSGLTVDLILESVSAGSPPAEAFVDPDAEPTP